MSACVHVAVLGAAQLRSESEELVGDDGQWVRDRDKGYPAGAFFGGNAGNGRPYFVCATWVGAIGVTHAACSAA